MSAPGRVAARLRPQAATPMKTPAAPPASAPPEPAKTYAELLAEYEARRRATDDLLLGKMMHPRDPMNPA